MKEKVYKEVNELLNTVLKTEKVYDLRTKLLGEDCIIDSITIIGLISLCNDKYNIDIIENDINLECLENLDSYVNHICSLLPNMGE